VRTCELANAVAHLGMLHFSLSVPHLGMLHSSWDRDAPLILGQVGLRGERAHVRAGKRHSASGDAPLLTFGCASGDAPLILGQGCSTHLGPGWTEG
jgi:hypothetical protein